MKGSYQNQTLTTVESTDLNLQIIRKSHYQARTKLLLSPWFDLIVFYIRVSNFKVGNSTPEFLTLNHIPLRPDTLLEVNGVRSSTFSNGVSVLLRRDRVDRKSEEATFVSTDNIRLTGSVKFEVFDKEDPVFYGELEMVSNNNEDSKSNTRRWNMSCDSEVTAKTCFLRRRPFGPESMSPLIEVYVAGSFSGNPVILTKTLQLSIWKKHNGKCTLDAIPENETTECCKDLSSGQTDVQDEEYIDCKNENGDMYWRSTEYGESEDGELTWFNAGLRVGVGIGLGICVGVGLGASLIIRSYQVSRTLKRWLI